MIEKKDDAEAQTNAVGNRKERRHFPVFSIKKIVDILKNQRQLFPEDVASTPEEAEDFLDMVFATVVSSKKDVRRYFEEDFIDFEGSDPLEAAEVFAVGDGRYLIVDA